MTLIDLTLGAAAIAGVILVAEMWKWRKSSTKISRLSDEGALELQRALDTFKANRERERTEALLAENLKNAQEPIPWYKVPKSAPFSLPHPGGAPSSPVPSRGAAPNRPQPRKASPHRSANTTLNPCGVGAPSSRRASGSRDDLSNFATNIAMANLFNSGDSASSSNQSNSGPCDNSDGYPSSPASDAPACASE